MTTSGTRRRGPRLPDRGGDHAVTETGAGAAPDVETAVARRVPRNGLTRHVDAGLLLETFLLSAVAAVLVTRAFLQATGFPKVGGDGLHIAHLLPGGLLMVVGLMLLFVFL